MQGLSLFHSHHLHTAFALLRENLTEERPLLSAKDDHVVQLEVNPQPVSVEPNPIVQETTTQLVRVMNQQEQTISGLQTIVNQLTELEKELKQLKSSPPPLPVLPEIGRPAKEIIEEIQDFAQKVEEDIAQEIQTLALEQEAVRESQIAVLEQKLAKSLQAVVLKEKIVEKRQLKRVPTVQPVVISDFVPEIPVVSLEKDSVQETQAVVFESEKVDFVDSLFVATESESPENCQTFFSQLPWSYDNFSAAVAQNHAAKPTREIPSIMQLATDSALKTAAQMAVLPVTAQVIEIKTEVDTCQSYFQTLPWAVQSAVARKKPAQVIEIAEKTDTCQNYFQTLPWAVQSAVARKKPAQVIEIVEKTDTCQNYFQTLPWAVESAVARKLPAQIIEREAEVETCQDYFQTVPWTGELLLQVIENSAEIETCQGYFQALPWQAKTPYSLSVKSVLTYKSLLQPFEITQQIQFCSDFFQTLPWTAKLTAEK